MIAFNLHEYFKNRCHFKWKLSHRGDTAHGLLGLGRTNFTTSHSISLVYINGILIMSVPWGRNFDIALIFPPCLSFPLPSRNACQLSLQHVSSVCHCLSILSDALMRALSSFLDQYITAASSDCLPRRGEAEEAARLVPPKKPIHHVFPLLKYHYSPYDSNQKDTSLECFAI